jgi:hypothetical protein
LNPTVVYQCGGPGLPTRQLPRGALSCRVNLGNRPFTLRRQCEEAWIREGALDNVRNWGSAAAVGGLILLAPIIAFAVVVAAEMLGDLMLRAGPTVTWPAVAGLLLRKFGGQTQTSRLGSQGA